MNLEKKLSADENHQKLSMVLYCLIRRRSGTDGPVEFLLIHKQGHPTFPPTKFRPGENLYASLIRTMEEDLDLAPGDYFPEKEIDMIPNQAESPRYPGLTKKWYLYPVDVSLTGEALLKLEQPSNKIVWWTLDEILKQVQEPNVLAIAAHIREKHPYLLAKVHTGPSMDALAAHWAARNASGVRLVRGTEIRSIIDAGSRAFNLRVADPYLPYQRQGLGFTWSFFLPKINRTSIYTGSRRLRSMAYWRAGFRFGINR